MENTNEIDPLQQLKIYVICLRENFMLAFWSRFTASSFV